MVDWLAKDRVDPHDRRVVAPVQACRAVDFSGCVWVGRPVMAIAGMLSGERIAVS